MLKQFVGSTVLKGAFLITFALLPGLQLAHAQGYPPAGRGYANRLSSPADRTVEDLRRISERNTFSHGDSERYQHAMAHLSEFSGKLYQGRFDRGKLDRGIGDVQNVLRRNRMDPRGREILSADLNELYRFRSTNAGVAYRNGWRY